MANQGCIAIGISQYQFLPTVPYASADAKGINQFFIDSAAWLPERCLLMNDNSSPVNYRSTIPTAANIREWLDHWCSDTLQPGDLLWVFFSGYGTCEDNTEYLIPIDGDVDRLSQTCLSLKEIYRQLGSFGINVVVCLDANRSQIINIGQGIGKEVVQLSQEYQITTFLSCQSDQFSHDAAGLGHGLFTCALLEALLYHPDLNINTLQNYLTSRLPELSEHHWRPPQTPVTVVPDRVSAHKPLFSGTTQTAIARIEEIPHRSTPVNQQSSSLVRQPVGTPVISPLTGDQSVQDSERRKLWPIMGIVIVVLGLGAFTIAVNTPKNKSVPPTSPKSTLVK
jgi:uncharacterized caspase-like protein